MTPVVDQPQLPLARRPAVTDVPLEIVMRCRDLLAAINLCIEVSGLDDKEVSLTLGIDAAQWSRIRKGEAHFPPRKLPALMRWLVRLVVPRGAIVLDPFAGSGSTVEACMVEQMRFIAIEREPEYAADIEARIARVRGTLGLELTA